MRFVGPEQGAGIALAGQYNPVLVTLSILTASLAAFAALAVVRSMNAITSIGLKQTWLAVGAVAMGTGIWAMHFIGMLAVELHETATYSLPMTLASVVPGIAARARLRCTCCT